MWPNDLNHAPHVYAAKDDLNPHFVRLNKEIDARFYSRPIEEVAEISGEIDVSVSSSDGSVGVGAGSEA